MPINPKTKEKVTWKEFFHQWKEGMRNITPLQQCITIQFGQLISAIGVVWGIIFSFNLEYWWMMVVLFGGLIILGVQYLGNWQKKVLLKEMDRMMKEAQGIVPKEKKKREKRFHFIRFLITLLPGWIITGILNAKLSPGKASWLACLIMFLWFISCLSFSTTKKEEEKCK